ncbi:MAG: ABC transporter ATP-binding protein [Myxococcales bacterium]|nr:MAG: ABC transporter ATP-binding protein [Myxococcales bacterium]
MALLLNLNQISLSYGDRRLFDGLSLSINEGERIGIIGANGAGKTSLLRLMAGEEIPEGGTVSRQKKLRVGLVSQKPDFPSERTVEQVLLAQLEAGVSLNQEDPQEGMVRAAVILDKLGFADARQTVGELSGGWLKRLALAVALAKAPELLLLDEPTNHLDLEGILWLEQWLRNSRITNVVISHDRAFLEAVATRIVEVNRAYPGGLLACDGGYSRFLEYRAEFRAAQAQALESMENKVRNEIEWLKKGPKARTSKDKGRIENAHQLIDELADLRARNRETTTRIEFSASGRKSKRLLAARGLSMQLGGRALFKDLDLLLKPGLRLGLVGANGSGKTTLLKILADRLQPDSGLVERSHNLRIVLFDQKRDNLNPDQLLRKALCEDGDSVIFQGRSIHVEGWARRFGFQSQQLDTPLGRLSGGEQAKAHIARLMLVQADVLLLDEPTNDLDLPTLEILEENLQEFPGAIVLVTHDRYLLDQVSTALLGLDGQGGCAVVADYAQWLQHMEQARKPAADGEPKKERKPREAKGRKKLTYTEQREYDALDENIAAAEAALRALESQLHDPAVASDHLQAAETYRQLQEAQKRVDEIYRRWEELETKVQDGQ